MPARVHGHLLLRVPDGAPPAGGWPILAGFHGYAETAERHLAQLETLPGAGGWALCAVQALHPFYTRGNEVVAGWMTRFARERAIADNVAYVAAAVAAARARLGAAASDRLAFLGFSQGVAMAYRAAADHVRRGVPCHGVVALSADVPPDVAAADLAGFPPVLVARGLGEDWYTEEKLAADLATLAGKGVAARSLRFAGGHEWTDAFRQAAGEFLREALG
ncbi:MAG TPA: phospholipase [Thermoanaerobaculia bacterium]|nr:phospholipase [Thermoanaerobaculia bacterium]